MSDDLWADENGMVPICGCDQHEFDHFRRTDCPTPSAGVSDE